ncbi:MAG TPA: glycine cleavage system protein GcvH [Actinomycetota bacterium]|nr:glycine cleavage system protein GcvH [Actinomycetota bacterium]
MAEFPSELRYTREHEWAREEDGRVVVGITDHAQDQLGDVVFVGLPEPGSDVTAGEPLGEVESTKSVSDIYSPVSGKVLEKNAEVEATPELVNEDPYGRGWLVTIEATGPLEGLLTADDYRRFIEESA